MTHRDRIRSKLDKGGYEDYKSLSISVIKRSVIRNTLYQVHCESGRHKFSELYEDIEEAIFPEKTISFTKELIQHTFKNERDFLLIRSLAPWGFSSPRNKI